MMRFDCVCGTSLIPWKARQLQQSMWSRAVFWIFKYAPICCPPQVTAHLWKQSESFSSSSLYVPICMLHCNFVLPAKKCLQNSESMPCLISDFRVIGIHLGEQGGMFNWHIELYFCSAFRNSWYFPPSSNLCKSFRMSRGCSLAVLKSCPVMPSC